MKVVDFLSELLKIKPDEPLHMHGIFWLPIIVFVTPALILSFPTWCLCWPEPYQYESILKAQGFPIFIASLAIPFTVAINRFHSSAQRAFSSKQSVESNRLTQQNMTFNHYFEHRNHFFSYVDKMLLSEPYRHCIKITEPDKLYAIIFPKNKIDHQDMSAPTDDVNKAIQKATNKVEGHIDGYLSEFMNGKELFKNETAHNFILKTGEPFGITLTDEVINYVDNNSKTVLDLCFSSVLNVIQKAGQFSHEGFDAYAPISLLKPLSLKKKYDFEHFDEFISHLESCLVFELPDEKVILK